MESSCSLEELLCSTSTALRIISIYALQQVINQISGP